MELSEGCEEILWGCQKVTAEERLKRKGVSKPQGRLEGRQSRHRKQRVQRSRGGDVSGVLEEQFGGQQVRVT